MLATDAAFIPGGKLHAERRQKHGLTAAQAEAGTPDVGKAIVWQDKGVRRLVISFVTGILDEPTYDGGEGKPLVGVKAVIQADRGAAAVPCERFIDQVFPAPDFVVTIGEPPTSEAEGEIGMRS
jgi:hypothetical protein